jgi:uncharacterized LabA/DUF88 family protein/cold shock CspA family protein
MNKESNQNFLKIGVFYDGNFVNHISDYYAFKHHVKSRLSLKGLEEFAINMISKYENIDSKFCRIVDSHLYKGRTTARAADERDVLYGERVFDDACMYDGVTTHYLPVKMQNGRMHEKGTDVWMALDAYETTLLKKLDIVVIVTSDTDFKPLIRKIHSLGAKTLLLSWSLQWEYEGDVQITRTSRDLTESVTWNIDVSQSVEDDFDSTKNIFIARGEREGKENQEDFTYPNRLNKPRLSSRTYKNKDEETEIIEYDEENRIESEIYSLKGGFGFISYPPNNIFFHASDMMEGYSFEQLEEGDAVEFQIYTKADGGVVAKHIKLLLAGNNYTQDEGSTQYF